LQDIFRRYPNQYESIIAQLCDNLESLDEPEAKASMIWIIGEYADRIDNADELLETFLETFPEETSMVGVSNRRISADCFMYATVVGVSALLLPLMAAQGQVCLGCALCMLQTATAAAALEHKQLPWSMLALIRAAAGPAAAADCHCEAVPQESHRQRAAHDPAGAVSSHQ
jgi:hypothetical protein